MRRDDNNNEGSCVITNTPNFPSRLLLGFGILLTAGLSFAQGATNAAQPAATDKQVRHSVSRLLEEVVVTAQKRQENVQDVPISMQAFSGEKLDALGITDQVDLQRITPGLNVTEQVSYTITFLRGIGTDATIAADPSVATYIDGIYYPFASNLAQNFGAVERIEVLKGPQGTLFGRNATGGAIAIHTKNPEFDGFSGEALAEVGSFGSSQGRLHVNVPIVDDVALSATAIYSTTDGYYEGRHGNPRRDVGGDLVWRDACGPALRHAVAGGLADRQRACLHSHLVPVPALDHVHRTLRRYRDAVGGAWGVRRVSVHLWPCLCGQDHRPDPAGRCRFPGPGIGAVRGHSDPGRDPVRGECYRRGGGDHRHPGDRFPAAAPVARAIMRTQRGPNMLEIHPW